MPIVVQLETERRDVLQSLPGPLTNWLLRAALPPDTICLRFVDAYGDAVFNRYQMPVLHAELERAKTLITEESVTRAYDNWIAALARHGPDIEASARKHPRPQPDQLLQHVSGIQRLIDHGLAQVHTYLWFIGD